MTLQFPASAIGMNISVQVLPVGGTAPYSFIIVPGGAGGFVSGTGVYVAPNATGVETIQCTDSLGAVATAIFCNEK